MERSKLPLPWPLPLPMRSNSKAGNIMSPSRDTYARRQPLPGLLDGTLQLSTLLQILRHRLEVEARFTRPLLEGRQVLRVVGQAAPHRNVRR
jgi:hypothetical protein